MPPWLGSARPVALVSNGATVLPVKDTANDEVGRAGPGMAAAARVLRSSVRILALLSAGNGASAAALVVTDDANNRLCERGRGRRCCCDEHVVSDANTVAFATATLLEI